MIPDRLKAIKELQKIRYDRAARQLARVSEDVTDLRRDIKGLRAYHPSEVLETDPEVISKHMKWREQRIRVLNGKLARCLAQVEEERAKLKREFGRKTALDSIE